MSIRSRILLTIAALPYCVWASAIQVRHFTGAPDRGMVWLWLSPAVGCVVTLLGLGWEFWPAQRGRTAEIPRWRTMHPLALALQYGGWALLSWRSLWMFFSWDGMLYLPAWCLLAAALWRGHGRWMSAS